MYLGCQTHILYFNENSGALLKYFGAPSGTGQDEEASTSSATQASSEIISEPQDEEPSTSSATQVSSQMLSEDEGEDPFASTSPAGFFMCVCAHAHVCVGVWVHAHVFMCASLHYINKTNNFPFSKLSFHIVGNNDFIITGYACGLFHLYTFCE